MSHPLNHVFAVNKYGFFKAQKPVNRKFDFALIIQGKKLYVHKSVLTAASETFKSMLAERWNQNATSIEIVNPYHSFDRFYQFVSYIYSGTCTLTDENVFALTDMAEFYGIPTLKHFCLQYLFKMDVVVDEIEDLIPFAKKFSLDDYDMHLKSSMRSKFHGIIKAEDFVKRKKSFIDLLSTFKPSDVDEDAFFTALYKWAEYQTFMKKEELEDESFDFDGFFKAEFKSVLCNVDLYGISFAFVKESILKMSALFSLSELYEIISSCKKSYGEEDECFLMLYELAKTEVTKQQKLLPDESFILNDAIKVELMDALPNINFHQMSVTFLMDFVVEKEFYFSFGALYKFLTNNPCHEMKESDAFEAVYRLAEKHVLMRQKSSPDPHFNLFVAIKMKLRGVLPFVRFHKMDFDFLFNFVAKKGFSFTLLGKTFALQKFADKNDGENVNEVGTAGIEIEVFKFAVKYDYQSLVETCRLYFEKTVDPSNVCEYVQIAYANNFPELKKKCLKILFEKRKEIGGGKFNVLPKHILLDVFSFAC